MKKLLFIPLMAAVFFAFAQTSLMPLFNPENILMGKEKADFIEYHKTKKSYEILMHPRKGRQGYDSYTLAIKYPEIIYTPNLKYKGMEDAHYIDYDYFFINDVIKWVDVDPNFQSQKDLELIDQRALLNHTFLKDTLIKSTLKMRIYENKQFKYRLYVSYIIQDDGLEAIWKYAGLRCARLL